MILMDFGGDNSGEIPAIELNAQTCDARFGVKVRKARRLGCPEALYPREFVTESSIGVWGVGFEWRGFYETVE